MFLVSLKGKLEAEISLVTADEASKNPVGKGRDGPQALDPPKLINSRF